MKAIAAVDENWGIGRDGRLLRPIPADLKRLKALTLGHPVILGRKTLESFPGGRPLPGRENLILSRTMTVCPEGARLFRNADELLAYAPEDSFVLGGGEVYRRLLPCCREALLTRIHKRFPADTRFPDLDGDPDWELVDSQGPFEDDDLTFSYLTYRRRERL